MNAQPYRKHVIVDDEKLRELTRHWQQRLRLNDWIIESWVAKKYDFPEEHQDGEGLVNYFIAKKQAEIIVLHPDDAPVGLPHDMEAILVHELLHLHLAPFTRDDDPLCEVLIEQTIECITAALMNTERDQVVRFNTESERKLAETTDTLREMHKDRDRYREKTLALQEKLDDLQQKYDQQNKDMAFVSENRQETAKENIRLRKRIKELEEHADLIASRASAEYHQGVEDALRRHQNGDRPDPSHTFAKEGAKDVASFRTPAYLARFNHIIDKHDRSATIRANVGQTDPVQKERKGYRNPRIKSMQDQQPTDYEDEPTLYEEPDEADQFSEIVTVIEQERDDE